MIRKKLKAVEQLKGQSQSLRSHLMACKKAWISYSESDSDEYITQNLVFMAKEDQRCLNVVKDGWHDNIRNNL